MGEAQGGWLLLVIQERKQHTVCWLNSRMCASVPWMCGSPTCARVCETR